MKCLKCGSENCQRLEVVYEGGTQNISTTSQSIGAGIAGTNLGGGGAHTKTTGISQSTLAQKSAPPQRQKSGVFVAMVFIGLFMLGATSFFWKSIGVILIVGCIYSIYKNYVYNKKEWPKKFTYWKNQWLCHKCGNIYHQEF